MRAENRERPNPCSAPARRPQPRRPRTAAPIFDQIGPEDVGNRHGERPSARGGQRGAESPAARSRSRPARIRRSLSRARSVRRSLAGPREHIAGHEDDGAPAAVRLDHAPQALGGVSLSCVPLGVPLLLAFERLHRPRRSHGRRPLVATAANTANVDTKSRRPRPQADAQEGDVSDHDARRPRWTRQDHLNAPCSMTPGSGTTAVSAFVPIAYRRRPGSRPASRCRRACC